MSRLPDAAHHVERHGSARLYLSIGATAYSLAPCSRPVRGWRLTVTTGPRAGSRYLATSGRPGLKCTCPDAIAGNRCKHLGALVAAGLLPAPRKVVQP
jgi:hypothetical protein